MIGTLINFGAILAGSLLGLLLGAKIPERVRQTVLYAMGFFVLALGIQMFLKTSNSIVVLASLVIGALLGEWWRIEEGLEKLGGWLESRLTGKNHLGRQSGFIQGFLTTTLLYCIGPMAILGAIQDGLTGDYSILAAKSILDGFASIAFSSTYGIGVLFSSVPLLIYQSGISLAAVQIQPLVIPLMMAEMTAVGGVLLIGLAICTMLKMCMIKVGNLLPALVIAPLLVALLIRVGWITP